MRRTPDPTDIVIHEQTTLGRLLLPSRPSSESTTRTRTKTCLSHSGRTRNPAEFVPFPLGSSRPYRAFLLKRGSPIAVRRGRGRDCLLQGRVRTRRANSQLHFSPLRLWDRRRIHLGLDYPSRVNRGSGGGKMVVLPCLLFGLLI